ncbi:MAG: ABC transporter ATP-binding protein [Phycisphaerales bacterium]
MISARHVSKWYGGGERGKGVLAVSDVSFEVESGQIVGLLGPNGAGKTTTLRMTTGYLPPSQGAISVAGFDTVSQSVQARRALGYLPEAAPLYPEMRVVDYLKYRAKLYGIASRDRRAAMSRVMARCWLTEVARRRIFQLSKGFKQRVGLAGAMLHDPPVLVLDEPTSGLDPTQIRETRSLIRELSHKRTVIVSSHILPEVEKTCDRVLIIARGRLRADGPPTELLSRMRDQSPYHVEVKAAHAEEARGLLERVPGVRRVERLSSVEGWGYTLWAPLVVEAAAGAADLREAIAGALKQGDILARELYREAATLEQLFFSIIEADEGPRDRGRSGSGSEDTARRVVPAGDGGPA